MALCPRGSVGAILRRGNEILMLDRISPPPGWALPAGHIDIDEKGVREDPEVALVRELAEEIGVRAKFWQLIWSDTLPNPCKKGFDSHEWWVYEVTEWDGEPRLMEPDKHRVVEWRNIADVPRLMKEHADPAWVMFFEKIEEVQPGFLQPKS